MVVTEMDFSNTVKNVDYPRIHLTELNDTTPLIISTLEEGDTPLLGTHNGVTKIIKKVPLTVRTFDRLLRTHDSVLFSLSPQKSVQITSLEMVLKELYGLYSGNSDLYDIGNREISKGE